MGCPSQLGAIFGVATSLTGLQHLNPLDLSPTLTLSLSVLNRFSRFSFFCDVKLNYILHLKTNIFNSSLIQEEPLLLLCYLQTLRGKANNPTCRLLNPYQKHMCGICMPIVCKGAPAPFLKAPPPP